VNYVSQRANPQFRKDGLFIRERETRATYGIIPTRSWLVLFRLTMPVHNLRMSLIWSKIVYLRVTDAIKDLNYATNLNVDNGKCTTNSRIPAWVCHCPVGKRAPIRMKCLMAH
jgi:hypothetical protein